MFKQSAWKTLVVPVCFASACLAAAAAPALAQTQPPAQRPPEGARPWQGPQGHHGPQAQQGPRGFSKPSERVEAMLAYQKTAIKITEAQNTQWNAYAEQVRKQAREMDQRMDALRAQAPSGPRGPGARPGQQPQQPNAIEGLERRQAMHAEAIRRINDRLAVQKPLYAALNPEQQKIADVVLGRGGRMAMAHMGPMGGRGGPGHFGGSERGMRGPMMRGEGGMPGPMMGSMDADEGIGHGGMVNGMFNGAHEPMQGPMGHGFTRS